MCVCADYGTVKVEPPTPSPVRHKYSSAVAHLPRWTNSLLKDVSQAGGGGRNVREKGKEMGENVCVVAEGASREFTVIY